MLFLYNLENAYVICLLLLTKVIKENKLLSKSWYKQDVKE